MNTFKDSKYERISTIKNRDENSFPTCEKEERERYRDIDNHRFKINKNENNIHLEEIEFLINKKKYDSDIKIYNMITKHQIEEKKIEELYNNEEDNEEKEKLLTELKEMIERNENKIKRLKMYYNNFNVYYILYILF
jgi:hypothetical protein